ncbi:MAG: HEAT repeat domain-containing protein, partial [Planctomycetota bacterium]|nr:HEAT repeat domain-containing protein [Planctomycetota bacterium]
MTRALLALCLLFGAPDFSELEKSYRQAVDDNDWKTVRRTVEVMAEAVPERAARFLSDEFTFAVDEPHRRALFHALTRIKRPEMLDFLREHISSGDAYERAYALEGFAAQRPREAFPMAVNCYRADDDARVRRVAIDVLASFKNDKAAEA